MKTFIKISVTHLFFFNTCNFMYLFLSALGLCCLTRAISACGERGLLFVVVRGLLVVGASPCGGFSCCGAQALGRQTQQLRRMGSSAESVAAAQGRSCSEARGMPPGQGLSQGALHWQADS